MIMPTVDPTPQQVLDLELPDNDSGARTVRGYLIALLRALWQGREGFSGKRPFGNSDWDAEFVVPFAQAGFIDLDVRWEGSPTDGWWEYDYNAVDNDRIGVLVDNAITALGETR